MKKIQILTNFFKKKLIKEKKSIKFNKKILKKSKVIPLADVLEGPKKNECF